MMWDGMEAMGWGWIGLGMLHMVVFWVLVILVVVALVRGLSAGARPRVDGGSAEEVLKRRYAAGEITVDEFRRMKRELAGDA